MRVFIRMKMIWKMSWIKSQKLFNVRRINKLYSNEYKNYKNGVWVVKRSQYFVKDNSKSIDKSLPDELKDQNSMVQNSEKNEQKAPLEKSKSNRNVQNKANWEERQDLQKQNVLHKIQKIFHNIMFKIIIRKCLKLKV